MAERVCLYAVVSRPSGAVRVAGVAGERLRRVRVAGVEVVIGTLPRVPRPTAAALRRYDRAVRELMQTHDAVLPARYGSCVESVDALGVHLRDSRDRLRRTLRLVRRRVQMTTRIFHGSDRGQTLIRPRSDPGQTGVRTGSESEYGATQGRQYLQRRAAELQIPEAEALRPMVKRWIRAERTERHDRGRLAGSVYHLIPRGAAPAYRRTLERAAMDAAITIIVTGPWPPYAFADADTW